MHKIIISRIILLITLVSSLLIFQSCNIFESTTDNENATRAYISATAVTIVPVATSYEISSTTSIPSDTPFKSYDKDIKVILTIDIPSAYVNIDNLTNEEQPDTYYDFYLLASGGTNTFISLKPINDATAYWSEKNISEYLYCVKLTDRYSDRLFSELLSSIPICLLTNEGHIASVQYVSSTRINEDPQKIEVTLHIVLWEQN
jgi:hypothetical protein